MMPERATPKKDEPTIEAIIAQAELLKIESEIRKTNAETRKLQSYWNELYLVPVLTIIGAGLWFAIIQFGESLSGEKARLESEIALSKQRLDALKDREIKYRQLTQSAETLMLSKQGQYDDRIASLNNDIASLQSEKTELAESVNNQLERDEILAEIYAAGGALDVISEGLKNNKFRLSFTKMTRVQNINLVSQFTNAPLFPFTIPNSHGDMNIGDTLVDSDVKHDVSRLVERSLELLNIDAILLETPDFVVDRDALNAISLSKIRALTMVGPACSDEWLALLENNSHLQSLSLFDTTTSPAGVVHFIDASPKLSTVEYIGARQDLSALREGRSFGKIKHLHVSTIGSLDPQHLAPFQNLDTLAISCPIMPKATWPAGVLSSLKYLVLKDTQGVVPAELSSASRLQLLSLSFQNRQVDADTSALSDILRNFNQLVELHLDLNYANFNIDGLRHNLQLRYLGLSHAKISGDFKEVSVLRDLRVLRLHGSPVSSESLARISRLPYLETLDLSNLHGESNLSPLQRMSIESLNGLQYQRSLRNLRLEGNYISEKAIKELASMTWLRTLSVSAPLDAITQTRTVLEPLREGTIMNLQPELQR